MICDLSILIEGYGHTWLIKIIGIIWSIKYATTFYATEHRLIPLLRYVHFAVWIKQKKKLEHYTKEGLAKKLYSFAEKKMIVKKK